MALTRFPHGVSSFGLPVIGSGTLPVTTGSYFFVCSVTGNAANSGTSPSTPLATITGALAKCTDSVGDVIVVMPGHAETCSSAGALAVNKIGVTIIGLGNGGRRPTVTLDTATSASVTITAADVTIKNILFAANLASIVTVFTVTANDFRLEGCEFRDTSTILNFINIISTGTTANTCDGLTVVGNRVISLAAGFLGFVLLGVASDRFSFCNNDIATLATGTGGGFGVRIATFNITNAVVAGNTIALGGGNDVTTGILILGAGAASSGTVCDNRIGGIITTPLLCATTLTMAKNQNYTQKTTTSNGVLNPAGA